MIQISYEINDRILALRKELRLSQTDFGRTIGVTRGVMNNIELHNTTPSDLMIDQIVKNHPVNREWLETGKGEMFCFNAEEQRLSKQFGELLKMPDSSIRRRLITGLVKLDESEWAQIEAFILRLLDEEAGAKAEKEKGED